MKLVSLYNLYLIYNMLIGIGYALTFVILKGFIASYNLAYGIIILALTIFAILRLYLKSHENDKVKIGVQSSWLIVSFGLGYISLIYSPVLSTSIPILILESMFSIIQILWGSTLLGISYKKGYSIIKV